ncbi:hypothetical protein PVAP13_5NG525572 [Panicum virgatum]|uniref:Uncharacterized protein n=1 Tax=Panicum virgatum TaxID=38727 RepID=A0A8T0RZN9_PANVG|nr:hypothetical protein PVAP13_5NG525572 [Panicum virgatum]
MAARLRGKGHPAPVYSCSLLLGEIGLELKCQAEQYHQSKTGKRSWPRTSYPSQSREGIVSPPLRMAVASGFNPTAPLARSLPPATMVPMSCDCIMPEGLSSIENTYTAD